jgi:hypothetical protein
VLDARLERATVWFFTDPPLDAVMAFAGVKGEVVLA